MFYVNPSDNSLRVLMSISVTIPVIGVTECDMGRYYLSVNQTSLKMGVPQLLGEHFWLGPEYNLRSEFGELTDCDG